MRKVLVHAIVGVLALADGHGVEIGRAQEEARLEVPERGPCAVCTRRGAAHGDEGVVAHRVFGDHLYTFCSRSCAEAFDQMPEGYARPVLPRPAPRVELTDLDGEPVALGGPGARAVLVDFWATWCKPCLETMPVLEELFLERSDEGLRVVGISIDEDREALERFLRKREVAYPVAHDGDAENPAWWAFRVPAIPALFLIDEEGNVVEQWSGEVSAASLQRAIEALLASEG